MQPNGADPDSLVSSRVRASSYFIRYTDENNKNTGTAPKTYHKEGRDVERNAADKSRSLKRCEECEVVKGDSGAHFLDKTLPADRHGGGKWRSECQGEEGRGKEAGPP